MAYLLAKYTLLFLLATLLGFLLGRWWTRRNLVEVTESYESLTQSAALHESQWKSLWTRLDALDENVGSNIRTEIAAIPKVEPPVFDLSGVESRLDTVTKKVEGIHIPEQRETDLSDVLSGLSGVSGKISAIRMPDVPQLPDLDPMSNRIASVEAAIKNLPQPKAPDFEPISNRLTALESAVKHIPRPELPEPVDLSPLSGRIGKLEDAIARIPRPRDPVPVDLNPINTRIGALEAAIARIPRPEKPRDVNLEPLTGRIGGLERAVAAIPKPQPPSEVDLQPIDRRLSVIEVELKRLRSVQAPVVKPSPKAIPKKRSATPKLFTSPTHGTKDDLKKISGVGPKLEGLLNKNGVYYFWQVSQWNKKDIDLIDARLQVFKGRISRDNWVTQARSLKRETGAAKEPK